MEMESREETLSRKKLKLYVVLRKLVTVSFRYWESSSVCCHNT